MTEIIEIEVSQDQENWIAKWTPPVRDGEIPAGSEWCTADSKWGAIEKLARQRRRTEELRKDND